jgi:hypothetical protein
MGTLSGLKMRVRCTIGLPGTERLRLAAPRVVGLLMVMLVSTGLGAQEISSDTEQDDMTLDLFETDRPGEESPARKRLILEIPHSSPDEEQNRQEGAEPAPVVPSAAESDSELRQVVRGLQQDLEMLKEEIAQLRSELRELMPIHPEEETVAKQTVNPFWISDAQLDRLEQR